MIGWIIIIIIDGLQYVFGDCLREIANQSIELIPVKGRDSFSLIFRVMNLFCCGLSKSDF